MNIDGQLILKFSLDIDKDSIKYRIDRMDATTSSPIPHTIRFKDLALDLLCDSFDAVVAEVEKDDYVEDLLMRKGVKLIPYG